MNRPPQTSPIKVLLVEDDANDIELTLRALQGAKLRNRVHVARDGADALDHLQRQVPDLILLDLNLLKVDGREVLEPIDPAAFLKAINTIGQFWPEVVKLP